MADSATPVLDRRRLLSAMAAVAGTAAVAGCSWEQTGATDVVVHSAASAPRTVSITISGADAQEPHTSETLELSPGEQIDPVNRSKLPTNGSYTVAVDVEEGPSETFQWEDPDVELAPLYVLVDDTRNIKFLLQAG